MKSYIKNIALFLFLVFSVTAMSQDVKQDTLFQKNPWGISINVSFNSLNNMNDFISRFSINKIFKQGIYELWLMPQFKYSPSFLEQNALVGGEKSDCLFGLNTGLGVRILNTDKISETVKIHLSLFPLVGYKFIKTSEKYNEKSAYTDRTGVIEEYRQNQNISISPGIKFGINWMNKISLNYILTYGLNSRFYKIEYLVLNKLTNEHVKWPAQKYFEYSFSGYNSLNVTYYF